VYSKRSRGELADTALTLNLATAVLLFALAALAAPFVAAFGGQPTVRPIVTVLGFSLIVSALGSVHGAYLTKDLAYRAKLLPDVVGSIAFGVTSIGLAAKGFGPWSIVLGFVVRTVVSTVLLWIVADVRPLPRFNRYIALELVRFGRHVSIMGIVGFGANNVDYFL